MSRRLLPLVWAYLCHHPIKSWVLFACLSLSLYLPFALYGLGLSVQASLMERASQTPLLIGMRGSQLDLVLHGLYHRTEVPGYMPQEVLETVRKGDIARAIPLFTVHSAKGHTVVATSLDYFDWRKLTPAEGSLPMRLGDCVLGAKVARELGLGPGDRLLTDNREFFDLAGRYPLNMRITGILEPSNPADDAAVFVDLRTAWLVEGIGHGHDNLHEEAASDQVLAIRDGIYVGSPALREFTEVTSDNIRSFHFHGDPASFPLTAVIAVPRDERAETLLLGRFIADNETRMAVRPVDVVSDLFERLLPLKRLLSLQNGFLIVVVTSLISLVVLLSLRLRQDEFQTMEYMGCSRGTIAMLWLSELAFLLLAALLFAAASAAVTVWFGSEWLRGMIG
jgi:putative ABC transport system permease protein